MTDSGSTPLLRYWVSARPLPGQAESGDQYLVAPFSGGTLVAAIDGLGHGDEAAQAAKLAVAVLAEHAAEPVVALMQHCHEQLRRTRGVVMTLVSFRDADSTATWLGVGNVECILMRADAVPGDKRSSVLLRGGIVGDRLPPLVPVTVALRPGDLLVLATDGIASAFVHDLHYPEQPQDLIYQLFSRYMRDTDDALLLGVQWKNGSAPTDAGQ